MTYYKVAEMTQDNTRYTFVLKNKTELFVGYHYSLYGIATKGWIRLGFRPCTNIREVWERIGAFMSDYQFSDYYNNK